MLLVQLLLPLLLNLCASLFLLLACLVGAELLVALLGLLARTLLLDLLPLLVLLLLALLLSLCVPLFLLLALPLLLGPLRRLCLFPATLLRWLVGFGLFFRLRLLVVLFVVLILCVHLNSRTTG